MRSTNKRLCTDVDRYFEILKSSLSRLIGGWILKNPKIYNRWLFSCDMYNELRNDYRLKEKTRLQINGVMRYDFKGDNKPYHSITEADVRLAIWYYSRIYLIPSVYLGIDIPVSVNNGSNISVLVSPNGDRYLDIIQYKLHENKYTLVGTYDNISKMLWGTDYCNVNCLSKILRRTLVTQCNISTLTYAINHLVS